MELENTVEGMVPIQSLLDDYYIFDEQQYQLIGDHTGRVFTLGQKVNIIVDSVDKGTKTIDFVLAEFYDEEEEDEPLLNDWMNDDEVDQLLQYYEKKNIGEL